jgi:hypothetical protein
LDVHVEPIAAIQVPHLRPPAKSLILIDWLVKQILFYNYYFWHWGCRTFLK